MKWWYYCNFFALFGQIVTHTHTKNTKHQTNKISHWFVRLFIGVRKCRVIRTYSFAGRKMKTPNLIFQLIGSRWYSYLCLLFVFFFLLTPAFATTLARKLSDLGKCPPYCYTWQNVRHLRKDGNYYVALRCVSYGDGWWVFSPEGGSVRPIQVNIRQAIYEFRCFDLWIPFFLFYRFCQGWSLMKIFGDGVTFTSSLVAINFSNYFRIPCRHCMAFSMDFYVIIFVRIILAEWKTPESGERNLRKYLHTEIDG